MSARDPRKALAARRNARRSIVFSTSNPCPSAGEARAVVLGRAAPRPAAFPDPAPPDEQAIVEAVFSRYAADLEAEAARYPDVEAEWLRTLHGMAFDERVNASSVHEACAARGAPIDGRFKRAVGLGVRAYLERVRLRAARLLMPHSDVALQTVALAVGYANYETFNRAVKRRFGISPSQLRNDAETDAKRRDRVRAASKNEALLDVLGDGGNVKAERQPDGGGLARGWSSTGTSPLRRRRTRGQKGLPLPLPSPQSPGLMTITDVKGYPTDDGGVSRIDIEGDSPHLDKLEVSLEVTGKQLKRSVTVRKDRTWTARFKASDGVDLLGFNCGTLVRAGASSKGDDPQHVVWTGCVRCAEEQDGQKESENSDDAKRAVRASSDGQPVDAAGQPVEGSAEPLVLVRRGEGDGDQAVVTVTVGRQASGAADRQGPRPAPPKAGEKRTRRRSRRPGDEPRAYRDGDYRDDEGDDRYDADGAQDDDLRSDSREADRRDADRRDAGRRQGDREDAAPRRREPALERRTDFDEEPPRAQARDDEPASDRHAERNPPAREQRYVDRRDRQRDDRTERRRREADRQDEEATDGREPVSWMLGSLVMITTALFLFAIAAQAYPVMVGLAALFTVPTWALVLAGHTPASWARWAGAGVGLASLGIPAAMPFVDIVEADVYLVAAGITALGIAIAAGLLFFRTGDDADDERDD